MRWQRKARVGVAIFGIAFAAIVYSAIGERQSAAPPEPLSRLDPRAIIESIGAGIQQFREATRDYAVDCERQLTYEDGSTRCIGITIKVAGRGGRDFVVTGKEASATENQRLLEVVGEVKMAASDGLVMNAERASFDQGDAIVRVPGAVTFQKGGMSGSGVGMTYDQDNDVLTLTEEAHVTVTNEAGEVLTDFTAGTATLSRLEDYLSLSGNMHVMRGEQVIEADSGIARLTENEEHITFIELRGNSRVVGGATFDSLSARDVDLDYTDDGAILERAVLTGQGAIALKGANGETGRQFLGESLDFTFAPDNTVTRVVGRNNVQLDLPAGGDAPARTIKARAIDASGEPGKGLTQARFTDDVEYREQAQRGAAARVVRSRTLAAALSGDAVTGATFAGTTRFEEQGLTASAARAIYDPVKGVLQLRDADSGGGPTVEDAQIRVEATTIDVTLEGRTMLAKGTVRTTLRPRQTENSRLPGLLEPGQAAAVNGDTMEYQGGSGKAIFTGRPADLVQGGTAIRAETIALDQETGDLVASRNARATLMLDAGVSQGNAAEIRYQDARRLITFDTPVVTPPAVQVLSRLSTTAQGDLQALRIEVFLAEKESAAERLEAYTSVSMELEGRRATANRMTYFSADGRYDMTGLPTMPVTVFETENCRTTTGRTVTFFKDSDRIIVDGVNETRTQSRRGTGPCVPPPVR